MSKACDLDGQWMTLLWAFPIAGGALLCLESFIYIHLWHQEDSNYPTRKHSSSHFFLHSIPPTIFLYPSSKDFFSFSLLCSLLNTSLPPPHFHPILWYDYSFPGYQWLTAKSLPCPVYRTLPSWCSFLWMSSYSSRTRSVWIQCSPKHIFCPFLDPCILPLNTLFLPLRG